MNASINTIHLDAGLFSIRYAGRELSLYAWRRGEVLDVTIDEIFEAQLKIEDDGNLRQLLGDKLPDPMITLIKKQLLGNGIFN